MAYMDTLRSQARNSGKDSNSDYTLLEGEEV